MWNSVQILWSLSNKRYQNMPPQNILISKRHFFLEQQFYHLTITKESNAQLSFSSTLSRQFYFWGVRGIYVHHRYCWHAFLPYPDGIHWCLIFFHCVFISLGLCYQVWVCGLETQPVSWAIPSNSFLYQAQNTCFIRPFSALLHLIKLHAVCSFWWCN